MVDVYLNLSGLDAPPVNDVRVDPTLLFAGVGLLVAAALLGGGRPKKSKRGEDYYVVRSKRTGKRIGPKIRF